MNYENESVATKFHTKEVKGCWKVYKNLKLAILIIFPKIF